MAQRTLKKAAKIFASLVQTTLFMDPLWALQRTVKSPLSLFSYLVIHFIEKKVFPERAPSFFLSKKYAFGVNFFFLFLKRKITSDKEENKNIF